MILDEYLLKCNEVYHTTLDPEGPGVLRLHLVPPRELKAGIPWVLILNGYYVLPVQTSWAVLLKIFIDKVNETNGNPYDSMDVLIDGTLEEAKKVFPKTIKSVMKTDLKNMLSAFKDIAKGKEINVVTGFTTIAKYSKFMGAPHRLDLMVSSMEKDGVWNCNQKCVHCYAANEKMSVVSELHTESWKKIIDKAREAHIPQLTFTGGEPTIRKDLIELIEYSKWFVTRLNTNGILLTKEYTDSLAKASLDSIQITFYSDKEEIHNLLVGSNNYSNTVKGIKNAIESGLDVSINTPLCSLNKKYVETIKFLHSLGVKYFTCSGLIPSGNAVTDESVGLKLTNEEITKVVKEAFKYAKENELEIAFTSPGWIDDDVLKKMKMNVPSCGACMSNMAIAPDGTVLPCQSWLFADGIGNMLFDDWKDIWKNKECKKIRKVSSKLERKCQLNKECR